MNENTKTIVIGSGFGGIAAALRLRALGHEVTIIEKLSSIGGRAQVFNFNGFKNMFCRATALQNGGTTEEQRRNNGETTEISPAPRPPVEAFQLVFLVFFTILIFEPLLEPLQLKAVREK